MTMMMMVVEVVVLGGGVEDDDDDGQVASASAEWRNADVSHGGLITPHFPISRTFCLINN